MKSLVQESLPPFREVLVAIPNMGWIRTELALELPFYRAAGADVYAPVGFKPASRARNECVKMLLALKKRWIWFIDADTWPPRNALPLMLDADVPAISGLARNPKIDGSGRLSPVSIVARRGPDGIPRAARGQGVERIDRAGSACILIRREVFEQLEAPWYSERIWPGPNGEVETGQDFVFCEKLEAAGIPLFAHFSVVCRHRTETDI